jgi:hypothetical protein
MVTGNRKRPESQFDADAVFAACAENGVAVEINSRPERLDPPRRLLQLAVTTGCRFSIDTDAHAPGQLEWQQYGCARAVECGMDQIQSKTRLSRFIRKRRPRCRCQAERFDCRRLRLRDAAGRDVELHRSSR